MKRKISGNKKCKTAETFLKKICEIWKDKDFIFSISDQSKFFFGFG